VRSLVVVAALVGGFLVLVLGRAVPVPWQPGCSLVDPSGAVLAQGSPAEFAALVADADGQVGRALGRGPAVSCRVATPSSSGEGKEAPLGLTPRAQILRDEVLAEFGRVPDGGFGPERELPGRNPNGEHSLGRAIDFFFRPYDQRDQQRLGWQLANWAVANADRLGIRTVIYRDHIWTARRSIQGWRDYRFSGPDPDNPVNRHLDHVHIDVA
jgi:hypothetical protein